MIPESRFEPVDLEGVEPLELYRPGGLHPVCLGDVLGNGRYRILRKLGAGAYSTVWLARNEHAPSHPLVSLKVLTHDTSMRDRVEFKALCLPDGPLVRDQPRVSESLHIQSFEDCFIEQGPNGAHQCLVSRLAGPSILALVRWGGRLQSTLVRSVAKQVADAVAFLHSRGYVHGGACGSMSSSPARLVNSLAVDPDLTSSNVLFQVSDTLRCWSDQDVHSGFGQIWTEDVRTCDGTLPGPTAPHAVVEATELSRLALSNLLLKDITLVDFGQTFALDKKPADYTPATTINNYPPEMYFEMRVCPASDVWMLGCLLFELRAGYSLFPCYGHPVYVIRDMVLLFGRLPDPWWGKFQERGQWFDETGASLPHVEHATSGTLRDALRRIGRTDNPNRRQKTSMQDTTGAFLNKAEVEALGDLLEKMLRYRPEDRIALCHAVHHPWFGMYDVCASSEL
jgi:serine/threonine-protein kinase SRPK3